MQSSCTCLQVSVVVTLMRFFLLQSPKAEGLLSRTCLKTLQPQTRKTSTTSLTRLTLFGKKSPSQAIRYVQSRAAHGPIKLAITGLARILMSVL